MEHLTQDIRIALRGFRRTPAFTGTVLVILGLGIGGAVAMFTVFRAVLLQTLPVREAERLVVLSTYKDPAVEFGLQLKDLKGIVAASRTLRDIGGYAHWGVAPSPLVDGDRTLTLNRVNVSGNFFAVLGAVPAAGRLLRPGDAEPGAEHVMVIGYNTWRRAFAGDSAIAGKHIREPYTQWSFTIVGVEPAGLDFPAGADFYLADGAEAIAPEKRLAGAKAVGVTEAVLGNGQPILRILFAAVGLLLLIACVNVGNLLLLRAAERTRELAVRRALGARYADLTRQLLLENGLLAAGGGVLGIVVAELSINILLAHAPPQLPRTDVIALAGAPVAAAFAVTVVATLFFGVAQALLAARADVAPTLRLDWRSGGESRSRRRATCAGCVSDHACPDHARGRRSARAKSRPARAPRTSDTTRTACRS
jgi:hypothetical protein